MVFNPDDPHDGEAAAELGYKCRIVHMGPDVVRDVLAGLADAADVADDRAGLPLFDEPVVADLVLARALLPPHTALVGGAGPLVRGERLTAAVGAMVRRGATGVPRARELPGGGGARGRAARRARALLEEAYVREISAARLARAAGCGRLARYRAFRSAYAACRMVPSDFVQDGRATSSGSCGCAGRAGCWWRATARPRPRPRPGSPTRAFTNGGLCGVSV